MAGTNGTNGRHPTRVVVTGMGAITAIGNSVEDFWKNATGGVSGIDILQSFDHSAYPVHIAAEVKDFDPEQYMDRRDARRMARFSQFAIAGAHQALKHADLDPPISTATASASSSATASAASRTPRKQCAPSTAAAA
jgi:3-oxoacyl-(acyl-carrier-protein) synthase